MARPSAGLRARGRGLAQADIAASFPPIVHMDISVRGPAVQRGPGIWRLSALLLVSELLESRVQIRRFRGSAAMETMRSSRPERRRRDRSPLPQPDARRP